MSNVATYSGVDSGSGKGRVLHVGEGVILSEEPCDSAGLPVLSPGLVDLQVNGYGGHDLNAGMLEPETVEALSKRLCGLGVAAYLPTLITASERELCQRMTAIRTAQQTLPFAKQMIAGIHVEGPSISAHDGPRGAHPAAHIRPPSLDEFERWQNAAGGLVRVVTLAPEVDGARDYIRAISKIGVIVALGHSDACAEQITAAAEAGACLSTHLGNGIAATLPRHPNIIWAQLGEDRLFASLILDGHHLPSSTARAMIRAKGIDRVCLISDSVKFAGMAAGRYVSPIGGAVEMSETGRVSVAGTPYLAGSGASLLDMLKQFTPFVDLPFTEAVTMAARNPARLLGRASDLNIGDRADFILFDVDEKTGHASPRDIVFGGESVQP